MSVKLRKKKTPPLQRAGQVFAFIGVFLGILLLTVFIMLKMICGCSEYAKDTFITTVLETGQMKFLASVCLSEEEINEVISKNSVKEISEKNINEGMINVSQTGFDQSVSASFDERPAEDIEIIDIAGLTYKGTLMIVHDPSRVSVTTVSPGNDQWPNNGVPLKQLVEDCGALGGINGGLYNSTNNCGGNPYGIAISNGQIMRNRPDEASGLVFVGLTENNILQIIDLDGMKPAETEALIDEMKIRDGVCFQEETSVDNNHFVQLVINGKPREITGSGSGLNPRTAIGQRADGALLLLVTDGRGSNSHAGASAADLIEVMLRYGAVNAANLDGGSSTSMFYDGEYLQSSVTFYYSNSSWKLPCAFVVDAEWTREE